MKLRYSTAVGAALAASVLGGCATAHKPDPLEPVNRVVFKFNDVVDSVALKPAATVYEDVTPAFVRRSVNNFFSNFRDVWSAANLFLQGRGGDGMNEVLRISVNTTFGIGGFFDVAGEMGLNPHRQDLGITLGRWGVGPGAYIVWPFFGPSTVRDMADLPAALYIGPEPNIGHIPTRNVVWALDLVRFRANLLPATRMLDDLALDKYTFTRSAYLQRRQSLIEDSLDDEYEAEPNAPTSLLVPEPTSPILDQSRMAPNPVTGGSGAVALLAAPCAPQGAAPAIAAGLRDTLQEARRSADGRLGCGDGSCPALPAL